MIGSDLSRLDLVEIVTLLRRRAATASEVLEATLANIARFEPHLNAFIHLSEETARSQAADCDRALAQGRYAGLLCGVPVSLKDNIAVQGAPTTGGSTLEPAAVAMEDATVTRRLRANGAVLVGNCNMHELAFAAPHPAHGAVRNPWGPEITVGGSSSGSASAVSACLCSASVGTDTGGSIRIPASFCGVVGLKPTQSAVDRSGVISVSTSLDHVGPLARTVRDAALVFLAIRDASSAPDHDAADALIAELELGVRDLRLGYVPVEELQPLDVAVADVYEEVCVGLSRDGASLRRVELPSLDLARSVFRVIATAEIAEQERKRFGQRRLEYGGELRDFLDDGETIRATDYIRALRIRAHLTHGLIRAIDDLDAIILPTVPCPPYREGLTRIPINGVDQDAIKVMTQYTTLFNLAGCPALSTPAGLDQGFRPIGVQIAAPPGGDVRTLRVGRACERLVSPGLNLVPTLLRQAQDDRESTGQPEIHQPSH